MEQPKKLLNKNFVLQWQGQTVSRIGTQIYQMAVFLWILDTTGSASLMALLPILISLPVILLGPIGGAFADRYSRKKIIVYADLFRGIIVIGLTILVLSMPEATVLLVSAVLLVALLNAMLGVFFGSAIQASIPDLVPKANVVTANSMGQLSVQFANLLGSGFAGMLYRLFGAPLLFLINGLSFLYSSASESFVEIPQQLPERSKDTRQLFKDFLADTREGLRYVWQRRGLREAVLASALLTFFASPIIFLYPIYVRSVLVVPDDWIGFLSATAAIGSILGAIVVNLVRKPAKRAQSTVVIIILNAIGFGILGLVHNPYLAMILASFSGFASGFVGIVITTNVQITTPGAIRGRVFGVLTTLTASLAPIGNAIAGVLADALDKNVPVIYLACGITMTILALMITTQRSFRQFLASPIPGPEARPVAQVTG